VKLTININLDNAAFADDPHAETREMLRRTAEDICDYQAWHYGGIDRGDIRDANGNTVGTWAIVGHSD
jgi:hypothetical protein